MGIISRDFKFTEMFVNSAEVSEIFYMTDDFFKYSGCNPLIGI